MSYIDGFVAAVPTASKEEYIAYAKFFAEVLKDLGALQVMECWEDDVPEGKLTSFPMAVKKQADESVVFSWIVWPSKEVRDQGMAKMIEDPRLDIKERPMPFDGKRLIYGGFTPVLAV